MAAIRHLAVTLMCGGLFLAGCRPAQTVNPALIGPKPLPITPPTQRAIEGAIARGVDFLVRTQNADGSWGKDHSMIGGIYAPVPGGFRAFKAAATSMALSALIETASHRPDAEEVIRKAEAWLLRTLPKVRRESLRTLFSVWAHAYAIQALVDVLERRPLSEARRKEIRAAIKDQVRLLGQYQSLRGGWGYYHFTELMGPHTRPPNNFPMSSTTGTVMFALYEARRAGIDVPDRIVKPGLAMLRHMRAPDFSYTYLYYPVRRSFRAAAWSLARSQACNAALYVFGDERTTLPIIKTWLDRLYARNGWLEMASKHPVPHAGHYAIASYFFLYAHYYAGECIALLPPDERPYFQDHLAHILLPLQLRDGSWWDFPLHGYYKAYGTAYALMALQHCLRPELSSD